MRDVAVDLPSGTYAAIDFGGAGPDVLLVHQIASSAQVWATLGPALARHAHPVAVDLCGHGHTLAVPETLDSLVVDLPAVVRALGLRSPLVVLENEELLCLLGPAGVSGLEACGVLVVGPFTSKRGKDARRDYEELIGLSSLDEWDERSDMFATGPAHTRDAFVERRVAGARVDWVNTDVSEHQLRTCVQRQLRSTGDGWERVPRRPLVEEALSAIGVGPYGLDLYDRLDVPVWLAVGADTVEDREADRFAAWAADEDSRRAVFLPGYDSPDSFEPVALARCVGEMLSTIGGDAGGGTR